MHFLADADVGGFPQSQVVVVLAQVFRIDMVGLTGDGVQTAVVNPKGGLVERMDHPWGPGEICGAFGLLPPAGVTIPDVKYPPGTPENQKGTQPWIYQWLMQISPEFQKAYQNVTLVLEEK